MKFYCHVFLSVGFVSEAFVEVVGFVSGCGCLFRLLFLEQVPNRVVNKFESTEKTVEYSHHEKL